MSSDLSQLELAMDVALKGKKYKRQQHAHLDSDVESRQTTSAAVIDESATPGWDCSGVAEILAQSDIRVFRKYWGVRWPNWLWWGLPASVSKKAILGLLDAASQPHARRNARESRDLSAQSAIAEVPPIAESLVTLGTTYRLPKIAKAWSSLERREFEGHLQNDVRNLGVPTARHEETSWAGHLIHRSEIPLVIATLIGKHPLGKPLAALAINEWRRLIDEGVSDLGWISAVAVPEIAVGIASLARIVRLARRWHVKLPKETRWKVEFLVLNALRLLRSDGRLLFGGGRLQRSRPAIKAFQQLTAVRRERRLAQSLLFATKRTGRGPWKKQPETGTFCEQTGIGILRGDWRVDAPTLVFAAGPGRCFVELASRDLFLAGNCVPTLRVAGQEIPTADASPELNLHHADEDVEYLELEWKLASGVVWQRQALIARRERFLFLADAVLSPAAPKIEYRCRFPLARSVEVISGPETREVQLLTRRRRIAVLPVTMGEWKEDGLPNRLEGDGVDLCVDQATAGAALWSALVIDFDNQRSSKPQTWRRLTVGENLAHVPSDRAMAVRFQMDRQQFVAYRSLAGIGNRSYLGVNVCAEFAVGRMDRKGDVHQLLMVE